MIGTHQRMLVSGVFLVDINDKYSPWGGRATSRRSSKVESMAEKVECRSMDWFPAELLRGEMVWRRAARVFMQFIISLRAAVLLPPF
jgi:hypothetical protein